MYSSGKENKHNFWQLVDPLRALKKNCLEIGTILVNITQRVAKFLFQLSRLSGSKY